MNEEDRRLFPPLAMLHSFALVARHGSMSRAAAELGLGQSAVSRQIANLEEWLGTQLFTRSGRRIALNDAGRAYAEGIAPALAQIRRATRNAMFPPSQHVVELATLPSFGMRWLAPRLPQMTARYPDLVVNLVAQSDEFDFAHERFDAAIHVGAADWPDAEHILLFRERVVPVISPRLAHGQIREPRDLLRVPRLVLARRPDAWARWFATIGLAPDDDEAMPRFGHFLMLAQAVAAGAGAALLPTFLIERELANGELIVPFDLPFDEGRSYYFVTPARRPMTRGLSDLKRWITEEVAGQAGGAR